MSSRGIVAAAFLLVAGAVQAQVALPVDSVPPTDSVPKRDPVPKVDSVPAVQPAPAQGGTTVLVQPVGSSYTFGEGVSARRVEQLAIPIVMAFPFHRRFNVDLTTAAAYTRVVANDSTVSEIYGGTDTQIRANIQVMIDHIALTLGVNAPSGQYYVDQNQLEAASQIGNDFLFYPISSMGNGPAGTAGLAVAVRLLNWNLGVGGSLRKSMEFTAVGSGTTAVRYQPADETRLRLSAERKLWLGTASLGMTFAKFGEEVLDSTTYSTGDRVITNAAWTVPIRSASVVLGLWNLSRDAGEVLGGSAPRENVRNWSGALNLPVMKWTFQPSMESRRWEIAGNRAGEMRNYGISIIIPVGVSTVIQPRYGSSSGTLYSGVDGTPTKLAGWQGSLLIRRR